MADEIEGVEVLAGFLGERVQGATFGFDLLDDGLLPLGRIPPGKRRY